MLSNDTWQVNTNSNVVIRILSFNVTSPPDHTYDKLGRQAFYEALFSTTVPTVECGADTTVAVNKKYRRR